MQAWAGYWISPAAIGINGLEGVPGIGLTVFQADLLISRHVITIVITGRKLTGSGYGCS